MSVNLSSPSVQLSSERNQVEGERKVNVTVNMGDVSERKVNGSERQ